jgi:hypothetical protein
LDLATIHPTSPSKFKLPSSLERKRPERKTLAPSHAKSNLTGTLPAGEKPMRSTKLSSAMKFPHKEFKRSKGHTMDGALFPPLSPVLWHQGIGERKEKGNTDSFTPEY